MKLKYALPAVAGLMLFFIAAPARAASDLEVSGWIPYWKAGDGIASARRHLGELDQLHPFGYSVREDGELKDLFGLKSTKWKRLAKSAKSNGARIAPTVMWSDGPAIHAILGDAKLRAGHVDAIVSMVKSGRHDGVDIDYEAKLAETKDYFSAFLRELDGKLGDKTLSCTIEARTPAESRRIADPSSVAYANDYAEIGKWCDEVKIMAYDQGRIDADLNTAKRGSPYIPVADADWVRKVMVLAMKSIPKEKLVIGIPTYGYEYEVTVSPGWFQGYRRLWSLMPEYADETSRFAGAVPSRGKSGELSFSYIPDGSKWKLSDMPEAPSRTPSGDVVAQRALAYANRTGKTLTFNYVTWSDAESVSAKVALARELGIKGVAIFKIDGGEDEGVWEALAD